MYSLASQIMPRSNLLLGQAAPSALGMAAQACFGIPFALGKFAIAFQFAFRIAGWRIYARNHKTLLHYALSCIARAWICMGPH